MKVQHGAFGIIDFFALRFSERCFFLYEQTQTIKQGVNKPQGANRKA